MQVFDEKNPLDDDEKPSEAIGGGLKEKLNWMKVRTDAGRMWTRCGS
jgi:hypothetical protein